MVLPTPTEFADKWNKRLKGATAEMRAGADKVTEAPGVKAAEKVEKLKANWLARVDDGTWAREVSRVTLADWKTAYKEVGVPRVAAGADAAKPGMQEFGRALLTHIEAGQAAIAPMPDITLDDMIARMDAFIRHMATLKWKGR